MTSLAAQLDTLVQRRVRRDPVEAEKLEGPHPESDCDWLRQPLLRPLQKWTQPRIERNLPPQHPHYQCRGKVPVLWRKRIHARRVQQFVAVARSIPNRS